MEGVLSLEEIDAKRVATKVSGLFLKKPRGDRNLRRSSFKKAIEIFNIHSFKRREPLPSHSASPSNTRALLKRHTV